mgnify:CR=1 FL=1
MRLPSKIKFSDKKVLDSFEKLNSSNYENRLIYDSLIKAFEDIENNAFCGIQIPKRLIPKEYFIRYKINNLWKLNLPNGWRLLYSIESSDTIVVSIILEWMSHKEYENRFKY